MTVENFGLIVSQATPVGIIAIGMTLVILSGGIDLAAGAVLALVATVVGMLVDSGVNVWTAACIGLLIGASCGAVNGYCIARLKIPEIIVTLATTYVFQGVAVAVSEGSFETNFPSSFNFFSQGTVAGISFPLVVTVALGLASVYVLGQTRFGRRIYAIGGNLDAAKLAGIGVARTKFWVYICSGVLSAIAAIIFASQIGNVQASTAGVNLTFQVIAAVLIGGTSIFGGEGSIVGTVLGVFLLAMIENGLILSKVSVYWIDAVTGGLILAAIVLNTLQRTRNLKQREGDLV
jgi:ribose/xylose/arabinose/galactoside ABC-type transport system permease subunit